MARRAIHVRGAKLPVIRVLPLDSVELATVEPDDAVWGMDLSTYSSSRWTPGSIVRIRPPASASIQLILELAKYFRHKVQAKAIKVLPRPSGEVVIQNVERMAQASPRKVIMTMVDEANTNDREVLRSKMQEVLDSVGL